MRGGAVKIYLQRMSESLTDLITTVSVEQPLASPVSAKHLTSILASSIAFACSDNSIRYNHALYK